MMDPQEIKSIFFIQPIQFFGMKQNLDKGRKDLQYSQKSVIQE